MFRAQHRCSRQGRDGTVRAGCGSTEERCVSSWDPACRGGVAWLPVLSQRTGRYRLGGVGSGARLRAVAGVPSRSVAGRRTAKVSFLGLLAAARSLLHRARAALVSPCPSLRVPCTGKQEGNFHSCKTSQVQPAKPGARRQKDPSASAPRWIVLWFCSDARPGFELGRQRAALRSRLRRGPWRRNVECCKTGLERPDRNQENKSRHCSGCGSWCWMKRGLPLFAARCCCGQAGGAARRGGKAGEELICRNRRADLAGEDERAELVSAPFHPETSLIAAQLPSRNAEQTGRFMHFLQSQPGEDLVRAGETDTEICSSAGGNLCLLNLGRDGGRTYSV